MRVFIIFFLLVAIPISITTCRRNAIWKDDAQLWKDAMSKSLNKARPHLNLGNAYSVTQPNAAIKEFMAVLRLKPDNPDAHHNLGLVYFHQGRIDAAIEEYITAIRIRPEDQDAHYNLGIAYAANGLKQEARREFETALKLNPDFTDARKAIESLDKGSQALK